MTLGFTYNPAGQIATASRSNDLYSFAKANAAGNWTHDGLNQIATMTTPTLFPATHDARGNLATLGGNSFVYDSQNRLTTVNGTLMTLAHDPAGRLFQTLYNGATTTRFAYDGGDMIAEHDGANALLRRYVHGPGADEPLVWYEGTGTATRRWFHADERGSIVAVSDGAGALHGSTNRYEEFGGVSPALTGRFGYTGQAALTPLGLLHYKARTYWTGLGRFLQPDPIGYGSGMNLYAYVGGDPVNLVDPFGLQDKSMGPNQYVEPIIPHGDILVTACAWGKVRMGEQCIRFDEVSGRVGGLFPPGTTGRQPNVGGGGGRSGPRPQPPRPTKPDDPQCQAALKEPGNVLIEGRSFGLIAVLGISGSSGSFVNLRTGTSGKYDTIGLGAGFLVGGGLSMGRFRSLADFVGYGDNLSFATSGFVSADANKDINGDRVGTTGRLGVGWFGAAGTMTDTRVYNCKLGG